MKENNVPTLSIVANSSHNKMSRDRNSQPVSYFLRSLDGKIKIEISKFPFTIGRSLDSDLVINDKNVSRNHAVIIRSNNRIIIENRGSLNGIRVNKHKVDRVVVLHGDEIRVASVKYRLEVKRGTLPASEQVKEPPKAIDTYSHKTASNDDQLNGDQRDEVDSRILNQLQESLENDKPQPDNNDPQPVKQFNYLTIAIILSSITVIVLATILTLIQEEPDLTAAIEDVREKIVMQNQQTDFTYAGKIGNEMTTDNASTQQQPVQDQHPVDTMASGKTAMLEPMANEEESKTGTDNSAVAVNTQTQQFVDRIKSKPVTNAWVTEIPAAEQTQVSAVQAPQWEVTPTEKPTETAAIKPLQPESALVPTSQPKVASDIKPKPAPVKYSSYRKQTSIQKLDEARSLYMSGNYKLSERKLNSIASSSRHRSEYRNKANTLKSQISDSYKLYLKGQSEYAISNKSQAFKTWTEFLKKERSLFPHQTSQYSKNVKNTVALEYERKGRQAYDDNDWKNAYRYWRSAIKMRPKYEIENAIKLMDAELAMLYSKGNELARTNKPKAMAYWSNLMDKAPIDHEYYIKAKAKLRWLESITQSSEDKETL